MIAEHMFELHNFAANRGKSAVLNDGLRAARHDLIVTVDGDSWVREDGLTQIVGRLLPDPDDTRAVAGAVMVRNSRANLSRARRSGTVFIASPQSSGCRECIRALLWLAPQNAISASAILPDAVLRYCRARAKSTWIAIALVVWPAITPADAFAACSAITTGGGAAGTAPGR